MSNIFIKNCSFYFPDSNDTPAMLNMIIHSAEPMSLGELLIGEVPPGVEIVSPDGTPTSEFWVREGHHYLTVFLTPGGSGHDISLEDLPFYNKGNNYKYLDVVIANSSDEVITVKRKTVVTSKV